MPNSKNWYSILHCIFNGCIVTTATPTYAFIFDSLAEPSSVQIKLSEAGVVADLKLQVKKHFIYSYSMKFWFPENDQVERAHVRRLLGGHTVDKTGNPVEPGTPTPISLTIFAICKGGKEVEIYSEDVNPVLTFWSQDYFGKKIGSYVLNSGMYRVRLVNNRAASEFSSIPITLEIGAPAKVKFDPTKEPSRSKPCQQ